MPDISQLDAMILCGGLGTRLRSSVRDRPKALAEIDGRPFLAIMLDYLARQGLRRFILCAGYMARLIEEMVDALPEHDRIQVAVEDVPLGTGGALRSALSLTRSPTLLALNGDSLCPLDLPAMLAQHQRSGAGITLAVSPIGAGRDYGRIELNVEGRIERFAEKVGAPGHQSGWCNAGAYLFEQDCFRDHAPQGPFSLENELFPDLVHAGLAWAYRHEGVFHDIGTPERLRAAEESFRAMGLL